MPQLNCWNHNLEKQLVIHRYEQKVVYCTLTISASSALVLLSICEYDTRLFWWCGVICTPTSIHLQTWYQQFDEFKPKKILSKKQGRINEWGERIADDCYTCFKRYLCIDTCIFDILNILKSCGTPENSIESSILYAK